MISILPLAANRVIVHNFGNELDIKADPQRPCFNIDLRLDGRVKARITIVYGKVVLEEVQ
jgi:hypothetical protein